MLSSLLSVTCIASKFDHPVFQFLSIRPVGGKSIRWRLLDTPVHVDLRNSPRLRVSGKLRICRLIDSLGEFGGDVALHSICLVGFSQRHDVIDALVRPVQKCV